MPQAVKLYTKSIGPGHQCFIIAEAGVNHNGEIELARKLIDVAASAGADAVKFQTFRAEQLVSKEAPKAEYQLTLTDPDESQYDMLKRMELSEHYHEELIHYARSRGVLFLSSPFDEDSADFLEHLGIEAFKIPSGEITNLPFLEYIARKNKPMIVSTGMSTLGEVETAVQTVLQTGNTDCVLLHCVSNYPASPRDANLRSMETMTRAFGLPVGFSDHTLGIEVALAAVALGACVIEKHFTVDKDLPGPDNKASLTPEELGNLVRGIRRVEVALGSTRKRPCQSEYEVAAVVRKSIIAKHNILAGTVISQDLVSLKRPGTGIPPSMLPHLLGRRARRDLAAGELLDWSLID